jgi:hypothetical protein
LLADVQPQPAPTVTVTVPVAAPLDASVRLVGEIVYVHPVFCVTVNVCPATVSDPLRCGPVFAATE